MDNIPIINTSDLSYCMLNHAPRHDKEARQQFDEIRAEYMGDEVPDCRVQEVARRCAAIRILNAISRSQHEQQQQ